MQENLSPTVWADRARDSDQLRLLIEVSEAVATHRDLTALFRDLARRLPSIVRFEFIALFLHDPEKNVMRVNSLGTSDAESIPPGLELPLDQSYSGLVFTTQQPVFVNSLAETQFPLAAQVGLGFNLYDGPSFRLDVESKFVHAAGADLSFGILGVTARGDLVNFH